MKTDAYTDPKPVSDEEILKRFADRLSAVMDERGVGPKELERRTGISKFTIYGYLRCIRAANILYVAHLAEALGVPASELMK